VFNDTNVLLPPPPTATGSTATWWWHKPSTSSQHLCSHGLTMARRAALYVTIAPLSDF